MTAPTPPTEAPDLDAIERRVAEFQARFAYDTSDDGTLGLIERAPALVDDLAAAVERLRSEVRAARLSALNATAVAVEACALAESESDGAKQTAYVVTMLRERLAAPDFAERATALLRSLTDNAIAFGAAVCDPATRDIAKRDLDAARAALDALLGMVKP